VTAELTITVFVLLVFAGAAGHVIFAGLLRQRLQQPAQAELFAWGRVHGSKVQSLRLKYILPWTPTPAIAPHARGLLVVARLSAAIAACAAACLVAYGVALA
jgi:hypothetical protein